MKTALLVATDSCRVDWLIIGLWLVDQLVVSPLLRFKGLGRATEVSTSELIVVFRGGGFCAFIFKAALRGRW